MDTGNPRIWQIRFQTLTIVRPLIMGIVNVTPDSFSDGGECLDPVQAVEHGLRLVAEGADLLDIGGESTRPGAEPVSVEEELRRVMPVVDLLAKRTNVPISIDTSKPQVAQACLDLGAAIINDVTGLTCSEMVNVVSRYRAGAVVMHMQGTPKTMQLNPQYVDVVAEVGEFFQSRLHTLTQCGIEQQSIVLDPGIGFGKQGEHNWRLIANLAKFQRFGRPLMLGVSRKRFLGEDKSPRERLAAALAVACSVIAQGAVQIVRTHDVAATRDAFLALDQIRAHTA
ncbi:MAG: dihydropteroate synthase [Gemmataceae bacterium]